MGDAEAWVYIYNSGQSFTSGVDGKLEKVQVYLNHNSGNIPSLDFKIFNVDATGLANSSEAIFLETITPNFGSSNILFKNRVFKQVFIDVSSANIFLKKSDKYAFSFNWDNSNTSVLTSLSNSYSFGNCYSFGTWDFSRDIVTEKSYDFVFATYMTPWSSTQSLPLNNIGPRFSDCPQQSAKVGSIFNLSLMAKDANQDALTYSIFNAPSGLSLQGNLISWRPIVSGDFSFTANVSDGKLSHSTTISVTVADNVNHRPVFSATPSANTHVGSQFAYGLTATDANKEAVLSYFLLSPPSGMTISGNVIHWSPTALGTYTISLQVSDGELTNTSSFNIDVINFPPQVKNPQLQYAITGSKVKFFLNATDPEGAALTYNFLGSPPAGMTIADNLITWTPNSSGNVDVLFSVTDAANASTPFTVSILSQISTIILDQSAVSTSSYQAEGVGSGSAQSFSPSLDGTLTKVNLSVYKGSSAANLIVEIVKLSNPDDRNVEYTILGSAKVLSSQLRTFDGLDVDLSSLNLQLQKDQFYAIIAREDPPNVQLWWKDSQSYDRGRAYDASYGHLTIYGNFDRGFKTFMDYSSSILITNLAPTTAARGKLYSHQVDAFSLSSNSLTYTLSNQPSGMLISSTGLITWTPDLRSPTENTITVAVTNGLYTARQQFSISVPALVPPRITSAPSKTATEDVLYTYFPKVSDSDSSSFTFSIEGQPSGMTLSSNGLISWTPKEGDLFTGKINLIVSDGALSANQSFSMSVTPVNDAPRLVSVAPVEATFGKLYIYAASVVDPDDSNNGRDLIWSISGHPQGMTISDNGTVLWMPDATPKIGPITISVEDGGEDHAASASETFSLTVSLIPSKEYMLGDVNKNNRIDIFDALFIAEFLAGIRNESELAKTSTVDVNKNGRIEIFDALFIAERLANLRDDNYTKTTSTSSPVAQPSLDVTTRYTLSVNSEFKLTRSGNIGDNLTWEIYKNKSRVLSRNAGNELEYTYHLNTAGSDIEVHLEGWVEGLRKRVSNKVNYLP